MRVARRWLPVQVQPLPGESIDSWLEASALAMGGTVGTLAAAGELPVTSVPSWRNWLSPAQLQLLAAATGVPPASLEAMTLSRYDGVALRLDPESHRLDPSFPFGALSWSRFCPACIRVTGGRWQLRWRLGWSFACLRHNCLLVDVCPECGDHQRSTQYYRRIPSPAACRCGQKLGTIPTLLWRGDHGYSCAQRAIYGLLEHGADDFGVFQAHPQPLTEVLAAVRSLSNRALNFASQHGVSLKKVVVEATGQRGLEVVPTRARETLNNRAPQCALDTAVGVAFAWHVLRQPSISDAGEWARSFIEGQNADTGPAEIRSCARDSEVAAAIALKARSVDMGPEQQLRYRTATTMPRVPDPDLDRIRTLAARLPAAIWEEWASRLLPDLRPTVVIRETLSCAALLVGSTIKPVAAVKLLGEAQIPNTLNGRLWTLCTSTYWESMCAGVIRLSEYLEERGGPIDYENRRRLDYSSLLGDESWQLQVAERKDPLPPGHSAAAARCYLIERVSGSPTLALMHRPELANQSLTKLVTAFRESLTQPLVKALDQHTRAFLVKQGIHEPVYWHPPLKLLDGLNFR
jgi:hypothetical protein